MDSEEFIKLLQDDFDEKVFVSKVFESKNLLEPLKMVSARLLDLDASISQHVSKHNSELLSQTVELENFSNIVGSVESRIANISGNVNVIKQRLVRHYNQLNDQVTLIRRLGLVYETLRGVLRVSVTMKKLQASGDDIVQASECIEDLDYTFNSLDWKGITNLEQHYTALSKERERISTEAWDLIHSSFSHSDQTRLGHALQAFDNLSMLPQIIQALISDWQGEIEAAVKAAVDVEDLNKRAKGKVLSSLTSNTPGRASIPNSGGHAAAFKNFLWTGLDHMISVLDRCLNQVSMLRSILHKKRSSDGNSTAVTSLASRLFTYAVKNIGEEKSRDACAAILLVMCTRMNEEEANATFEAPVMSRLKQVDADLWEAYSDGFLGWIVSCLGAMFEPALRRRSGQLKEALESDYPRFLKLFLSLSAQKQTQQLSRQLAAFLEPFETAYLGRCLTRLFEKVNSTFVGVSESEVGRENLPRLIDAEGMVQAVATELAQSAAVQRELFCKVTRNVAKMVTFFSTKIEGLINTSPEAYQVFLEGTPTPAQQHNAHLVNFACTYADRLRLAVARHSMAPYHQSQQKSADLTVGQNHPQAIVDQALGNKLTAVCLTALEPLLKSIKDHIVDQILPRMHKEALKPGGEGDPAYVKDLQAFIDYVRAEYLTGYSTSPSAAAAATKPYGTSSSGLLVLFTSGEAALRYGLQTRVQAPCLEALAIHISLLRSRVPKTSAAVTRAAASMEMALASITPPAANTEQAFARLRFLRQAFALPAEEILEMVKSPKTPVPFASSRGCVGLGLQGPSALPGSLVLHCVIARAPDEIPLPHQTAAATPSTANGAGGGWSVERYTRWCLNSADEAARLAFVGRSLDVYVEQVEARRQKSYPPEFLVIRDLLEVFLEQVQEEGEEKEK